MSPCIHDCSYGMGAFIHFKDWLNNPRHVVMQFIGLIDKEGKDIYEGDVIETCRSYGYGFLPKGCRAAIEYDEKEACYFLRSPRLSKFRMTANKQVRIIGNIYENPELMEHAN